MKKFAAAILVLLLAAYAAYPYLALYRLGEALRARDPDAVEAKVDWPKLRQGIKDDINAALIAQVQPQEGDDFAAFGIALAGKLASPVIDTGVTPAGLAAAASADRPTLAALVTQVYVSRSSGRALPHLAGSSFSGFTAFEATVMPDGMADERRAVQLRFELEGGYWMLMRIHLPLH
ncbi:MAG TPA: DUF2939 domain-containing protein [Alphaproteobacteria bacterium]|jgi:hypothetical protein|nr:DUF2939 domain-containing protein [Alphaproteobacteria bacterium]